MRKMSVLAAGGLAVCLAAGTGSAQAQVTRESREEVRTRESRPGSGQVRRVSTLLKAQVQLQEGGNYGTVEDLVLNDNGCVEWLVLATGDEYAVVPWTVAQVNFERHVVRVDVTRERIQELRFTKDHWPNFSDPQYTERVYRVYGVRGRGGRDFERRDGAPADRRDIRRDDREIRRDDRRDPNVPTPGDRRDIRRDDRDQRRDDRRDPNAPEKRSPEDRNAPRRTEPPPPAPRPPQF